MDTGSYWLDSTSSVVAFDFFDYFDSFEMQLSNLQVAVPVDDDGVQQIRLIWLKTTIVDQNFLWFVYHHERNFEHNVAVVAAVEQLVEHSVIMNMPNYC